MKIWAIVSGIPAWSINSKWNFCNYTVGQVVFLCFRGILFYFTTKTPKTLKAFKQYFLFDSIWYGQHQQDAEVRRYINVNLWIIS